MIFAGIIDRPNAITEIKARVEVVCYWSRYFYSIGKGLVFTLNWKLEFFVAVAKID